MLKFSARTVTKLCDKKITLQSTSTIQTGYRVMPALVTHKASQAAHIISRIQENLQGGLSAAKENASHVLNAYGSEAL